MSFMKLDGIQGGSREKGFIGWIEIDAVSFGRGHVGGAFGGGAGRPSPMMKLEDMTFMTDDTAAFTRLMQHAASGARMARGQFVVAVQVAGAWKPTFRIDFDDAYVASVALGPALAGRQSASFSLHAEKNRTTFLG